MSLRRWAGDDDRVVDQALKPTGAIVWPTLDALEYGGAQGRYGG